MDGLVNTKVTFVAAEFNQLRTAIITNITSWDVKDGMLNVGLGPAFSCPVSRLLCVERTDEVPTPEVYAR